MGVLDQLLATNAQPGLGNIGQNTLFNVGLGLMGAGYDPNINPFQAVGRGIASAQAARTQAEEEEQKRLERENLARLREGAGGLIGQYTSAGHPGLQDTPGAALTPEQRQIAQLYEQMAQYGDPTRAATGFVDYLGDAGIAGGGAGDLPKSVAEWNFYSNLPEEQQKAYLEMKRGQQIVDIAGQKVRIHGEFTADDILSKLPEELRAKALASGAGDIGIARANRLNELEISRRQRESNYATAQDLLAKVRAKDLPTGLYTGLLYKILPTADQEKLDSLAMSVTRMKLKAAGETRTTDDDVRMMLRATFGSSSTEDFNRQQLESLLRDIEILNSDYQTLTNYFNFTEALPGVPAGPMPGETPPAQQGGGVLTPEATPATEPTATPATPPVDLDTLQGSALLEEAERMLREATQ